MPVSPIGGFGVPPGVSPAPPPAPAPAPAASRGTSLAGYQGALYRERYKAEPPPATTHGKSLSQWQRELYEQRYGANEQPVPTVPLRGGGGVMFDESMMSGAGVGGGFGGYDAAFQGGGGLPPLAGATPLQEALQPGMFSGSFTLLSAEVDPDGSWLAQEAVARGSLEGPQMVVGTFGRRPRGVDE